MTAADREMAISPVLSRLPQPSSAGERQRLTYLTLEEAAAAGNEPARDIAAWVKSYLMRPHPDLGRAGHVCPFTAKAARLALLRIGISPLDHQDYRPIHATMQEAVRAFDALTCKSSERIFRTVIVGFPNCEGPAGVETLRIVRDALRHHSVIFGKMIGFFEPESELEGLINLDFRPLRAPIPLLAIRMLVEQDAPFVVRNPVLLPTYLARHPLSGWRRLIDAKWPERRKIGGGQPSR